MVETTGTPSSRPPTPLPRIAGSAGAIAATGGRPARICVSTNVMLAKATSTIASALGLRDVLRAQHLGRPELADHDGAHAPYGARMQDTTPLSGQCACGAVEFEVTKPFDSAGYCHCKRCQRRSGALWSSNAIVASDGFAITEGAENVRAWTPETGLPKAFCATCGGHVYGGNPRRAVRGRCGSARWTAIPGIRPSWRAWLESAEDWHPRARGRRMERFQQARAR